MYSYTPINYLSDYSLEFENLNINLQLGDTLMKSSSPNLDFKQYVSENLKGVVYLRAWISGVYLTVDCEKTAHDIDTTFF